MDGLLWLHYKDKIQLYRCEIRLKSKTNKEDEFVIYDSDNKTVRKQIPLERVRKLSKNADASWELQTALGSVYRFLSVTPEENQAWFEAIDKYFIYRHATQNLVNPTSYGEDKINPGILTHKPDQVVRKTTHHIKKSAEIVKTAEQTTTSQDQLEEMKPRSAENTSKSNQPDDDESILLKILPTQTDKNVMRKLKPLEVEYKIFITVDFIKLMNNKTGEEHIFNNNTIRSVGVGINNDSFLISLGRSCKKYGPGILALYTSHPQAKIIYSFLNRTALGYFAARSNNEVINYQKNAKKEPTVSAPPTHDISRSRTVSLNVKPMDEIKEEPKEDRATADSSSTDYENDESFNGDDEQQTLPEPQQQLGHVYARVQSVDLQEVEANRATPLKSATDGDDSESSSSSEEEDYRDKYVPQYVRHVIMEVQRVVLNDEKEPEVRVETRTVQVKEREKESEEAPERQPEAIEEQKDVVEPEESETEQTVEDKPKQETETETHEVRVETRTVQVEEREKESEEAPERQPEAIEEQNDVVELEESETELTVEDKPNEKIETKTNEAEVDVASAVTPNDVDPLVPEIVVDTVDDTASSSETELNADTVITGETVELKASAPDVEPTAIESAAEVQTDNKEMQQIKVEHVEAELNPENSEKETTTTQS